ncbi:hypothetical protein OROMI_006676 [Orobanche minor]
MRNKRPEAYYEPFGGKIIVFGGDFRQILPVIPKGTRQDIVHATISSSPIWRHCKVLRLTKNMRLQYFSDHIGELAYLQGRAILAPTLEKVDRINEYMVSMHNTDERVYLSSDSIATTDRGISTFEQMHSVEYLNSIKCSGIPNHQLKLKVGVPVMLLRNIDHTAGLCNGTRLVVSKLGSYVIEARVLGGNNAGDIVYIPRMTLTPSDARLPFR